MMFIKQIDELKRRNGLKSDNQVAKLLKIERQAISRYRSGERTPDAYVCVRLALELEIDPLVLLAAVQKDAETGERATFWNDFFLWLVKDRGSHRVLIWLTSCALALAIHGQSEASVRLMSIPPALSAYYVKSKEKSLTKHDIIRTIVGWLKSLLKFRGIEKSRA